MSNGSVAEIPFETPESVELFERARELLPLIRARGDEIDAERRVPPDIIARLAKAGVFRMSVPKELGGLGVDPLTNFRVVEELASADASVGWVVMIASHISWAITSVTDWELGATLFLRNPDAIVGGFNAPGGGIATRTEGGYRITGRWPYGSGVRHSDYMVVSSVVSEGETLKKHADGSPFLVTLLLPYASLGVVDTWHTLGMRGTGSHDYTATDLFVPDASVIPLESGARRDSPMYRYPAFYLLNMAAPPLGVARAAIDALLRGDGPFRADRLMLGQIDDPIKNVWLAEAVANLGAARAYVFEVARNTWRALASGRSLTLTERATFRLALCHAHEAGALAVEKIYNAYGSSSFYETNPVERHWRDIQTMKHHGAMSHRRMPTLGQMLQGKDMKHPLF